MSANATISVNATVTDGKTAALGAYTGNPKITDTVTLSSTDITKVYQSSQTSAVAVTFNVLDGSLTDAYGNSLVFATVKAIVVQNLTVAAVTLTIGGGSNPLMGTDQITLKAGHTVPITSQFTVDGTHKVLTITPSASCAFNVLILGA